MIYSPPGYHGILDRKYNKLQKDREKWCMKAKIKQYTRPKTKEGKINAE